MRKFFLFMAFICFVLTANSAQYSDIAEKVIPSAVSIEAFYNYEPNYVRPMGLAKEMVATPEILYPAGSSQVFSGFFIDDKGTVMTVSSFISNASQLFVKTHNNVVYKASVIKIDDESGIGFLKLEDVKNASFEPVKISQKYDAKVGQEIFSVGAKYNIGLLFYNGIVSGKAKNTHLGIHKYTIQTSFNVSSEAFGAAVFNENAELIGMINESLGFGAFIPSDTLNAVSDFVLRNKSPEYGWIGIEVLNLNQSQIGRNIREGAYVSRVHKGTPAYKAGIKENDIIVEVNGERIVNELDLIRVIKALKVGEKADFKLIRSYKNINLRVEIEKFNPEVIQKIRENSSLNVYSIKVEDYNFDDSDGAKVVALDNQFIKNQGVLQEGDIIIGINDKVIKTAKDFKKAMEKNKKSKQDYVSITFVRLGFNSIATFKIPLDISKI